ncbi:alpha/beta fold hydrolase [Antrihabitans sp. YC2-6]|uniref:alpha/beta fold hydrolase n=1 Tax=Antrihabitans sp. YC2-6 TaxID=2799498 RepID=UPI0022792896|nr:alpha/beta fold hydrolase [Antrihabitans sp. YC2-6]
MLHGTPLTAAVWDDVRPMLSAHGDVFAPNITPPNSPENELQARLAASLSEKRLSGLPALHVVGHSFGGQVALELALLRPDLVSRLTLLCTRDTPFPAFAATADAVAAGAVDVDSSLQRWFGPDEINRNGHAVRYARRALGDAPRASWASALRAIATFDCSDRTPSISCPVTVIAAEHDAVSDVVAMEAMHRRLARSTFVVLPHAWHMSIFCEPGRLHALLQNRSA